MESLVEFYRAFLSVCSLVFFFLLLLATHLGQKIQLRLFRSPYFMIVRLHAEWVESCLYSDEIPIVDSPLATSYGTGSRSDEVNGTGPPSGCHQWGNQMLGVISVGPAFVLPLPRS